MLAAIILSKLVSLVSLAISGFLAYRKVSGWGWFLFVAALTAAVPSANILNGCHADEKGQQICGGEFYGFIEIE